MNDAAAAIVIHLYALLISTPPPTMSQFGGFMSSIGKWKDNEGPVKAACLSCRQKKAKCDGGRPACGQVSCGSFDKC